MLFLYFFPFCTELWISYLYDTDCYISCIITQFSCYLNWTFTISTSPILLVCFCIPSLFPIPSTWHFFTFNSVSHFLLQSKILFKAIVQTFTFFSISVSATFHHLQTSSCDYLLSHAYHLYIPGKVLVPMPILKALHYLLLFIPILCPLPLYLFLFT